MIKKHSEQIKRSAFGVVTRNENREMYKISRCPGESGS